MSGESTTATNTDAAPQATAPAAQPQGATVTPIKAHHAATQPRAEDGKFTQPPAATASPQGPRLIKVDDREVPEDELLADYKGRRVEYEAWEKTQREAAELRAQLERFKDPHKALTPEQRQEIARRELAEFLERQEEAKLPPEERARRQQVREAMAERDRLKQELESRQQQDEQAQLQADREYAATMVRATLKALGEEERPGVAMREVAAELRSAALKGLTYPPETVALRVRQRLDGLAVERVSRMPPAVLVKNAALVKALNETTDPAVLQALAPLIERGRMANLQKLGAMPAAQQQPTVAPAPLAPGEQPRTDGQWAAHFNAGNQPKTPQEFNIFLRLRDRGAVR